MPKAALKLVRVRKNRYSNLIEQIFCTKDEYMKWHFIPQPACFVEAGVTQRDQFRNDEVDLYETIVREAVQNSLDATANGEQTRVSFRLINDNNLDSAFLEHLVETQVDHARSSGLEVDLVDFTQPTALVIEDFGTSGLTGSIEDKDNDNFSDFWRRHGRSHKTGTSRGRWGLGKLVYSSSSMLGMFFGLTVRKDDPNAYLMGQTVLDLRSHDGKEYPAHAYFSDMKGNDIHDMIPVPTTDTDYIEYFSSQFGLNRSTESGLSIVIPFPHQALTMENMIGVAIVNYFYPVLTDQLVMEFDGQMINKKNIRELANTYTKEKIPDIDQLFDFIEESNQAIKNGTVLSLKESWVDDVRLNEDDFDSEDLDQIRTAFTDEKLVGIRLPLAIKTKPENNILQSAFHVFVKRPEVLSKGVDLYVRGGLTLPAESKFGERKAFGAMIANDETISSFLGDAENPAHTKWVYNAEKLRKNYVNPGPKLKVIKNAVINLYDMLTQAEEEEDEKALASFFFADLPEQPGKSKADPTTTPTVVDVKTKEKKPRVARIESIENGFSIRRAPGADEAEYPMRFRIRAAYDTVSGNPFKKFDSLDFDFTAKSGVQVGITKKTVQLTGRTPNQMEFDVTDSQFQIDVTGFDPNRDLLVKLNTDVMEGE